MKKKRGDWRIKLKKSREAGAPAAQIGVLERLAHLGRVFRKVLGVDKPTNRHTDRQVITEFQIHNQSGAPLTRFSTTKIETESGAPLDAFFRKLKF